MKIKTLLIAMMSTLFATGAYAAGGHVDFRTAVLGHDPAKVVPDTNVEIRARTQGHVDWRTAVLGHDPAKVKPDASSEITTQTHAQKYGGFNPYMTSHYPRFDLNNDGILSTEECRQGIAQLDGGA